MISTLPDEIWSQIFDLAADEDILFQQGFPTVMAESAWYQDKVGGEFDTLPISRRWSLESASWRLRSPQQAMNLLQSRSYATKMAIISTCRQWRAVGSEFLFRCLYFSDPSKLVPLCAILDKSASTTTTVTSSIGWWTRRIHVSQFHPTKGLTLQDLEDTLVSIIRHCPNLEIFVVERPMGAAFGPVADALAMYSSKKLHTVQWNVPGESIAKVIWALAALPNVIATHIDVDSAVPVGQECANLGAASNLPLKLPFLQQLSLRGYVEELIEHAAGWELPSLRVFSVDSGKSVHDVPDVLEFVKAHGLSLALLDLNCSPVDVPAVLDLCPNLTTFTFNADWPAPPHTNTATDLVKHPHSNITTIGLHGLCSAFGVGYTAAPSADPIMTRVTQRSNDRNVAALTRRNFPKLTRVRALSRTMLNDLNHSDGPSMENGGYERWNKWWNACVGNGIRLEDCTGQTLGTLPQDEQEESDEEDGDSDGWGSESEEEEEEDDAVYNVPPLPEGNGRTMELTRLLQEVRAMNEGRDEALIARIRIPRPDSPGK
ncbi:hypothetical protein JR316_0010272 [Psilocybe cubensis]|uniref:Uncharacterized protein n=2 Tax=Psilocybe cubensis TaxID=181762 RepID=A0ACB8GR50_PSICU|nr:hypothetical protein JR316_0010272 [Psilocybe cubensis]KAH9478036.1 hypothetical protein JR316_0010272 [Psilocybe cubensis]